MAKYEVKELPKLIDTQPDEREELFIKKLQLCCVLFDFDTHPLSDMNSKEVALRDMIEYIRIPEGVITEAIVPEILNMFSCNVFRTLPPSSNKSEVYDPDEEPLSEDVCTDLVLVYNFFFICLESPDFKSKVMLYINEKFVLQLLELFDSENRKERLYLKFILHRIYRCIRGLRRFIRKQIINTFYSVIYETESHNGVSELLQIVESIINGLATPLTAEYKVVLLKVLISLHKVKFLDLYYKEIVDCILSLIEKDPDVTETIIFGLLRLWPKMNSSKELLFLEEIEEIVIAIHPDNFRKVMIPVFRQITKCISSSHYRVAESALLFLNHENIFSFINNNYKVLLPILFPSFYENYGAVKWSETIDEMNSEALCTFMQMNRRGFDVCFQNYVHERERKKINMKLREAAWLEIETLAGETLELKSNNKLESAPADEPLPVDKASFAFKNLNLKEVAPLNENVPESAPADLTLPVDEASLTNKNLNLEEVAPLNENVPESAPADLPLPVDEASLTNKNLNLEEAAPLNENVAESAPADLPLPVDEKLEYDLPGDRKRGPIG